MTRSKCIGVSICSARSANFDFPHIPRAALDSMLDVPSGPGLDVNVDEGALRRRIQRIEPVWGVTRHARFRRVRRRLLRVAGKARS